MTLRHLHAVVRSAAPRPLACTLPPGAIAARRIEPPGVQVRLATCDVEGVLARVATGEADSASGPNARRAAR